MADFLLPPFLLSAQEVNKEIKQNIAQKYSFDFLSIITDSLLHYKCLCKQNQSYLHQYLRMLHAEYTGQSE